MHLLLRTSVCLLKTTSIAKEWTVVQFAVVKHFHRSRQALSNENKPVTDVSHFAFHAMETKKKETFLDVIRLYIKENQLRTGHVEFIKQALKYMDQFGVNRELEVYKALLDVFPKGKFIPQNIYQVMFYHYPKQQDTALQLLTKMEENQVMPDFEMQQMLLNIFGERGYPLKKLWRMVYWMPKFLKLNPWPCPDSISKDPKKLAQYSLRKMSSIDVQNKITVYQTKDVPDAIDDTWIVSSMSKSQSELLALQSTDKPLSIEGPFLIWMGRECMDYFVLKGDPIKREIIYETFHDVSKIQIPFWEKLNIDMPVTIHEQDDGVYYAMCVTGTSSKDSLLSWIRCLQKTNPVLEQIPIVFKLKSVVETPTYIEKGEDANNAIQTAENTKSS